MEADHRVSSFRQAIGPDLVICPHCGEVGPTKDRPASLLQLEQSGRWHCNACAHTFTTVKFDAQG